MKINKTIWISGLVILVILIGLGGWVVLTKKSSIPEGWLKFTDKDTNLSYGYPADLYVQDYPSGGYTLITNTKNAYGAGEDVLGINLMKKLTTEQTFKQFAAEKVLELCNADAPCLHASCPTIASTRDFTTKNGIKAVEFYLSLVEKSCADGTSEKDENGKECTCSSSTKIVGPVYYLDISKESKDYTTIELTPFLLEDNLPITPQDIKSVVDSFKF